MDAKYAAARSRQRKWLTATAVALLAALTAVLAASALFVKRSADADAEAARQAILNDRLRLLQTTLLLLGEAETGQRGYLLTGKPAYLDPYRRAVQELPPLLRGLDHIPVSDGSVQVRVSNIRQLMQLKLDDLNETIAQHDSGDHRGALKVVQTDIGQRYTDRLTVPQRFRGQRW